MRRPSSPFQEVRDAVLRLVPPEAEVTRIDFEGPRIAVYSRKPHVFLMNREELIKKLVKTIKKRVVVRGDPEVRLSEREAEEKIRSIVPEEANISLIYFNKITGEVEIEAEKPGYVIGKDGITLRRILAETLWYPKVLRKPPIASRTVYEVRELFRSRSEDRLKFLRVVGHRIYRRQILSDEYVRVIALGGFQEVGRSAILIETPESRVLLDAGVKPSLTREEYPYFGVPELDLDSLDAVVITHAHLDHCGALPYLFKYGYKGPVYMTEPTLYLMKLLQEDYLKIAEREGKSLPYTLRDVTEAVLHSYTLKYGEVTDIAPDIRLTLYRSGHILGAAIAHIHVGQGLVNIVYTSDFKFARTRILDPAHYQFPRVEVLIMETTYGGPQDYLPSRDEAERMLIEIVRKTFERGGVVLIPVLAVGRAQDVLIVLNEAMETGKLPSAPIYIEGMIDEVTAIHTAFPEYLTTSLRERIYRSENPFTSPNINILKHTSNEREEIVRIRPSIIMSTSGMLTGGPIMDYLRLLAEDEKSSLVFVSYQIEGTLGRKILQGLRKLTFVDSRGRVEAVELKMEVYRVEGFSGHSDRRQLEYYLRRITPRPRRVILVHGERSKMRSFKGRAERIVNAEVLTPQNLEAIRVA